MSFRKMKHKGRARAEILRDDMEYGDQMRHFISRLGTRRPHDCEIRYCDTE